MIIVFLLISILLVVLQSFREKNVGNMLSFLIVPYILLIFINNFIIYRFGFYKISDEVLLMLMGAFVAFFIGMCPFSVNSGLVIQEQDNEVRFQSYNIDKMVGFLYFVSVLAGIKLIYLIFNGDVTSGEIGNGIVGHLLLCCYAIVPIVFLYWTYNPKKLGYLISVCLIILMNFATFIKYNVISLIVCIFIFTLIYKKTVLKKACLLLVGIVVIIFVANYAIGFLLTNVLNDVSGDFYFNHLWTYCSGSLIYDNYIFTTGLNVDMSIFEKLACFIFALPNMFLYAFFGETFFPYPVMPFGSIGNEYGQISNVTDAIGYMFPSKGGALEIIGFLLFFMLIGVLFSIIYYKCRGRKSLFSPFMANFLTFFVFLSFFGTFYINSGPWEILIWSIVFPRFFKNRIFKNNKIMR